MEIECCRRAKKNAKTVHSLRLHYVTENMGRI